MLLQFVLQLFAWPLVFAQHHEGLHDLTADRIRLADDRRFHNGRMLDQGAFHFKWTDPITGALDDIIAPADEPKISVLIARGAVPREIPIALETKRVLLG